MTYGLSRNGGDVVIVGSIPELSMASGIVKLTVAVPSKPAMTTMSAGQLVNTGFSMSVKYKIMFICQTLIH